MGEAFEHENYIKKIAKMRLFDDEFFNQCMQDNPEAALLIIRIVMRKSDLVFVKKPETQKTIKSIGHKSIRLDLYCESEDKYYDVEIQRSDAGAGARRTRHYRSMLEVNLTIRGEDYDSTPDIYVIFITENDIWNDGAPYNLFEMVDTEHSHKLQDGDHVLYVNGAYNGDDDFGKLMHDFRCVNPHDIKFKELRDAAVFLKETEEGVKQMSKAMEEIVNEDKRESARNMLLDGVEPEKVSKWLSMPLSSVEEEREKLKRSIYE